MVGATPRDATEYALRDLKQRQHLSTSPSVGFTIDFDELIAPCQRPDDYPQHLRINRFLTQLFVRSFDYLGDQIDNIACVLCC